MMETEKFKIRHLGSSRDLRTNEWEFTCLKCKKVFKPKTTVLSVQFVECERCDNSEAINYNEIIIE